MLFEVHMYVGNRQHRDLTVKSHEVKWAPDTVGHKIFHPVTCTFPIS